MEQNSSLIAKKVWSLMRVMFFMLKKGISKTKLFADLNMIMKRGKIAGKALQNLLFHHHHNWAAATFHRRHPPHLPFPTPPLSEYEFSCTTTPQKHENKNHHRDTAGKPPDIDGSDDIVVNAAVMKALEMMTSIAMSPGFGKSPSVKQLRITDSPFPLSNGEEDSKVDEAADKFIMRFYNNLSRQN